MSNCAGCTGQNGGHLQRPFAGCREIGCEQDPAQLHGPFLHHILESFTRRLSVRILRNPVHFRPGTHKPPSDSFADDLRRHAVGPPDTAGTAEPASNGAYSERTT